MTNFRLFYDSQDPIKRCFAKVGLLITDNYCYALRGTLAADISQTGPFLSEVCFARTAIPKVAEDGRHSTFLFKMTCKFVELKNDNSNSFSPG